MLIGERIRSLREAKNLTQGDIQARSGLVRPYISRIENGHTVPSLETIVKFAHALEIPLYQLFYEGDEPPKSPQPQFPPDDLWGATGKAARRLAQFRRALSRMSERNREILLAMAQKMAGGGGMSPGRPRTRQRSESGPIP